MERLLHYVWKYKIYPLSGLKTTTNLPVEVIDPGLLNRDAGPDFFNAKVKIGDTLWAGNIEIHNQSSDWKRHGHHKDKSYDSVILHLAGRIDEEICRTDGKPIHQVQFRCPENVRARYEELKLADMRPRCYALLPSFSTLMVHSWFTALQIERLEQKTNQITSRLKRHNHHWEDVFFITLSRNFGFGVNGDAFEAWGNLLSLRAVDRHSDCLEQVEAMFFGQAGLLEEELSDPYYVMLQKEYRYLRHKFDLRQMEPERWKFLRLRPGNFPPVRLAQLACLYHQAGGLFSRIIASEKPEDARALLSVGTSGYWETHYNFSKTSPRRVKELSKGALDLIVINTVVPFLYAYGLYRSDERLCMRASAFLEETAAENNYITRLWDGAGLPVKTAADSQALIQLQKEYCDLKKCLHCRFGFEYLRSK
ncbi:MAG: DUF2851 family protein [Mediterranea sp.]|jgi:hypothetical protein|nr:DUF2851 family protein [Mediterranea sp.]